MIRHLDRGVTDAFVIDRAFIASAEARKLHALAAPQAGRWARPARIGIAAIRRPSELLDAVMEAGRKGLAVQRYKGLGEMNASQLWETTMDASVRRLLKVQIEDAIAADQIFTKLMGDEVEPRRAFIEQNALGARNIDV